MSWAEKTFEEQMTKYIDEIYQSLFSDVENIIRSNRGKTTDDITLLMDKELAIDTLVQFNDGTRLTFQEKTRNNYYLKYNDFTFEYYNDPHTKEKGEWFKLTSQYYFYGYANKDNSGYEKFYVIEIPKLRLFLKDEIGISNLELKYLKYNTPPAKANFFVIPFDIIPDECFFYKSEEILV